MPICPVCKKMVRRSDRVKTNGVWRHHHSSIKKKIHIFVIYKEHQTDEQLIRRIFQ